jgi:S1-C subfamily serine protease
MRKNVIRSQAASRKILESEGFLGRFLAMGVTIYMMLALGVVAFIFFLNSVQDMQSGARTIWLGSETIELNSTLSAQYNIPTSDGLLVSRIFIGSPADKGGLQVGDIIQRWNGVSLTSQKQIVSLIAKSKPGQKITLSVIRGDRPILVRVQLEVRPGGTPVT